MVTVKWALESVGDVTMGNHEETLRPIIGELFPDGGVLVDVGANVGLWSIPLGMRASKVFAVEPNPPTISMLRENIALNGLEDVVEVLEVAAWDSDVQLSLSNPFNHDHPMAGQTRALPDQNGSIPGRKLDDLISTDRIDLVKVDTEGADLHALRGLANHIAMCRPILFIESHHQPPYEYYKLEDLQELVTNLGYEYEPVRWASQYHLICHPV